MIANRTADGWELIYQPSHALLAAQAAARWRTTARPPHWWETLVAVSQHDNGWKEWEDAPRLTDEGTPRNFTETTLEEALAQWRRGVARGRHQGRWVGLLISRHATSLFAPRRGEQAALDHFLDEQEEQQRAWMNEIDVREEEVAHAYAIVRWTDWLSLILCWRRLPDDGGGVSLGEGPDGVRYQVMRRDDGTVTLDPWPFDEPAFTLSAEARHLAQATFADDAALAAALAAAPLVICRWQLAR